MTGIQGTGHWISAFAAMTLMEHWIAAFAAMTEGEEPVLDMFEIHLKGSGFISRNLAVIPAQAGIQRTRLDSTWISAFAAMTVMGRWISAFAAMTLMGHWIAAFAAMTEGEEPVLDMFEIHLKGSGFT